MTTQKAEKIINEILKEEPTEVGIFISLLSHKFLRKTGLSKGTFLRTLNKSLKICKKEGY